MTVKICDRCGARIEIIGQRPSKKSVLFEFASKRYDLCEDCRKAVIDFIENHTEVTKNDG